MSSLCHNPHTERREWKSSANPRTYDFNKTKINFGMFHWILSVFRLFGTTFYEVVIQAVL